MTAFLMLALGQSVELPATIRAQVGAFVLVKPIRLEGGKAVRYFTSDDQYLSVFPSELLTDSTATVLVASRQGRYKVFAVTAAGDKISPVASTIIVVGDGVDPDPIPPQPRPPQPKPSDIKSDPIYQQLVGIVGGLSEPMQRESLAKLSTVYQEGSSLSDCVDLQSLNQAMHNLSKNAGMANKIMVVREKLSTIIESELGTDGSAALAGGLGDKARKLFTRISAVLKELSNG